MATSYIDKINGFKGAATEEVTAQHNSKVQILKNQLAQNKLALEQQKTGVNKNFDTQVENQNINNKSAKGNYNNNINERGLGRSSIQATGTAEMDQINNRYVGAINDNRTGALGDIDSNITLAENNFGNTFATMEINKIADINTRAREMGDRQLDLDYKDRAFDYQTSRDSVADNRYADSINYRNSQDVITAEKYADSIDYRDVQDLKGDARYNNDIAYRDSNDKKNDTRYANDILYRNTKDTQENTRYNDNITYRNSKDKQENTRYNNDITYRNATDKKNDTRYNNDITYRNGKDKQENSRYNEGITYRNTTDKKNDNRYNTETATANARYNAAEYKDNLRYNAAEYKDNSRYNTAEAKDNSRYKDKINQAAKPTQALTNQIAYVNRILNEPESYSEKKRMLDRYSADLNTQVGPETDLMVKYVKTAQTKLAKQLQQFTSVDRYAGYSKFLETHKQ